MIALLSFLAAVFAGTPVENLIENHNWYPIITQPYQVGGSLDIFWAILYLLGIGLIYIKTQDIAPTSAYMMIVGGILIPLLSSPVQFFIAACVMIGVAAILYRALKQ
jgi:hypothetical protein